MTLLDIKTATPAKLDPVTFQPPVGEPPTVHLGLTYDEAPAFDYGALGRKLPLMLALVVGAYVFANYAGGRI